MSTELRGAIIVIYHKKPYILVEGTLVNPPKDGYKYGKFQSVISKTNDIIINGKFKLHKCIGGETNLIPDGNIMLIDETNPIEILVKEKKLKITDEEAGAGLNKLLGE